MIEQPQPYNPGSGKNPKHGRIAELWRKVVSLVSPILYVFWEPMPEIMRKPVIFFLKSVTVVALLFVAILILTKLRPQLPLKVTWGDLTFYSDAARTSVTQITNVEAQAKDALARIEKVDRSVEQMRATIDSAFTLASDARRISGVATQTLEKAQQTLEQIESDAEFIDLVVRAMTGFADAYDKLSAVPGSDPRFAKAYNMRLLVEEQHALWNSTFYKPARLPETFGTNWSVVTMPQVTRAFSGMTLMQQLQCLTFVRDQGSFDVNERLEFLYDLARSNANLRVRSRAGQCYMELAGIVNVNNPLAIGLIEQHHATNSASKKQ